NIADGAITSIKLGSNLQSDNFVPGVSGWEIRRNTGDAEFNNVTVRGTIYANAGELGSLTVTGTLTLDSGASVQTSNFDPDPNHGLGWGIMGTGDAYFYGGLEAVSLYSYGYVAATGQFLNDEFSPND